MASWDRLTRKCSSKRRRSRRPIGRFRTADTSRRCAMPVCANASPTSCYVRPWTSLLESPESANAQSIKVAFRQRAAAEAWIRLPLAAQRDVLADLVLHAYAVRRAVVGFLAASQRAVALEDRPLDAELAENREVLKDRPRGEAVQFPAFAFHRGGRGMHH